MLVLYAGTWKQIYCNTTIHSKSKTLILFLKFYRTGKMVAE